jgi:hypothetical protein
VSIGAYGAAFIASGGAVVGSMIATIPNAVLAHRRDRRDASIDHGRVASEIRLAARLIAQELEESAAQLVRRADGHTSADTRPSFPTAAWQLHRSTLASALESPADWRVLTHAYSALAGAEAGYTNTLAVAHSRFLASHGLDDREVFLELMYAVSVLELLVGDELIPLSAALEDADRLWPVTATSG